MLIGLDFDNTIVCYDKAIARLADELFELPPDVPLTKLALRDFFRKKNREPEWTAFQGQLYGPGMAYAEPFDQALETIHQLKAAGHSLCIVSHRSLLPYAGPPYDLHAAARGWIEEVLASRNLISNTQAFFYQERDQKISAIGELGCEIFIDDLPEVLNNDAFPRACEAILFDPEGLYSGVNLIRIARWGQLLRVLQSTQ